jgi:hypothetical protein
MGYGGKEPHLGTVCLAKADGVTEVVPLVIGDARKRHNCEVI